MEFEQVIRLVEAVSKSGLTDFDYEEGNLKPVSYTHLTLPTTERV